MADASVFPLEQLPHENFVRLMEIEDYEFNRLLDHYNIHPEVTYDTTSDFALLSMVEAGLGISIVHSLLIKPGRYRVATLPLNVKQSLKIGDHLAHGGLRIAQFVRRLSDAAGLHSAEIGNIFTNTHYKCPQ